MAEVFSYRDDALHVESVPLERLAGDHGTPLYVYSRAAIVDRYRAFDGAFEPLDRLIAYSVKANGNLSVLGVLAEAGAGADIVSGGELYRASRAGIPAERIVFSGAGKTATEIDAALDAGIYGFNVESAGELELLAARAEARDAVAPIALRINPDIEAATPHHYTRTGHRASKFGVPPDEALRLYRRAARDPGLEPKGIDVHIGSQIREVEPYGRALEHVLRVVDALRGDGIPLEYLDLGGGFGVAYRDEDEGPDIGAFADALVPELNASGLRLVLEPGRYVVGPAGVLLTRVLYVKHAGDKTFVITDAGMTDLVRPSHYAGYHRIDPVLRRSDRGRITADIVGPVCETGDFLALDREIQTPEPGELLAIRTAGAYGFTMASTYNARPRPAEVMVDDDADRLIRRRERYDDLVRGETELFETRRCATGF